ncbi:TonB-dependent receptor [Parvicella tangerina]|uniref:Vitamin B12 transporter BtuB n=1 Tax=Parvicella tangerina TaxID=2829795 RepID=A0A916JK75_9FLAO|nr:TonB-dependent receptor [Parvicella tangerina]CAG5078514.1 Vitamin B12 transporter BtuB [Parvicella tangerina]
MLVRILIMLWLLLVHFFLSAQQVTVVNRATSVGIQNAEIRCVQTKHSSYTNEKGVADLDGSTCHTFIFSAAGYDTLRRSATQLAEQGYMVGLQQREHVLEELMVSTYKPDAIKKTSVHIEPLSINDFEQSGAYSISDALATIPGVSQLSTGIGISKPVIRGLYGNRVLVLMSGLRFDNQQWQDEHGLGLTNLGLAKVELIKGPLSLLYGTDAVGGIVNLIEEKAPEKGFSETELKTNFHSNTLGGSISAGHKVNYGNHWFRLRLGTSNHCDYTDGHNQRVLNSRFNSQNLKASFGFNKGNWNSVNHYFMSYSKFGFIFSDITHFMDEDSRWNREMSGPHHIVFLNTLASVNTIKLAKSELKLNVGLQSNYRSEDEGGGELSLKMLLLTGQYALKWEKMLSNDWLLIVANSSNFENNTNYGKRKIVPDAVMMESSASAYLKFMRKKVVLEYGLGAGIKNIQTFLTPTVNSDEKEMDPFHQNRTYMNTMLGTSWIPDKHWNIKLNLSTGVRAPNLAELSANGLHEGIYTYEIGDPNMKNERNVNADIGVYRTGNLVGLSISGFYNYFKNYIYLQPTTESWYGFPVSRFVQYDAAIYGAEATVSYALKKLKGIKLSGSYALLIGELENGEYLPYMPANKLTPEVRYERTLKNRTFYVFSNANIVSSQQLVNPYEDNSPGYQIINLGTGYSWSTDNANFALKLVVKNMLNEAYYDHLSRFKNFGLLNIGRDVSLQFNINFKNQIKNKL